MDLIDSHCHLNDREAFPNPAEAIAEAEDAGVSRFIVVGVDTESSRYALELADEHSGVYAVVGWHPNSAASFNDAELRHIEAMLDHPKVVAIGEIGLDFHWTFATREQQERALFSQLALAAERDVPIVFHCREAYADLLEILEGQEHRKLLLHCFAGNELEAERALALGALLGVDGPITYPKSEQTRSIFANLPADRIVIETDSPWMPPVPHRGKRNRPAWLIHVNEKLAEVRGLSPDECAALVTRNTEAFFGL